MRPTRYLRPSFIALGLLSFLWSCGSESDKDVTPAAETTSLNVQEASTQVRACGSGVPATAAALGFNLVGETYAKDIVPIVTDKCVRCHGGDANMQNSTTCGFLEKNIDAVIVRLQNALAGEAQKIIEDAKDPTDLTKLDNNGIRDAVSGGDRTKWPMPPIGQNAQRQITQGQIDIFQAWKSVPDKCVDVSTPDEPLPDVTDYTDADEETARVAKIFEGETCKDGPSEIGGRAVIEPLLALPADSTSAFYDYDKKEFVAGAVKMEGNCTIDYFIEAVGVIPGAADALKEYKDYGWFVTQCAIVDGRPQAYLAHVASVTTALGDRTYGAFLKLLRIKDQ